MSIEPVLYRPYSVVPSETVGFVLSVNVRQRMPNGKVVKQKIVLQLCVF